MTLSSGLRDSAFNMGFRVIDKAMGRQKVPDELFESIISYL